MPLCSKPGPITRPSKRRDALKAAQSKALAAAKAKIKELKEKASSANALGSQVDQLKNEEKASKVLELEVEILELKRNRRNTLGAATVPVAE